jgi:predicted phosphoserine aminotransferase
MKLFIPGPIWVHPDVLQAMTAQPLGHRSKQFEALYARVKANLKKVLATQGRVLISTSSGSGVWELVARSCVRRRALACMCGAFSDKWADVVRSNGKEVVEIKVEWGKPNTAEQVADALNRHDVDSVLVCHNETSTGLTNRVAEIAAVVRQRPDVLLLVDSVSGMGGIPLDVDGWGVDLALASTQKAFGVHPGLAVFTASERAIERAKTIPNRGYYFDLLEFVKQDDKNQTVSTPALPQIYSLDAALGRMLAEGMEARFARHRRMADLVRDWARRHFALFPEPGHESDTLTCIRNTRKIDVSALNAKLLAQHDCIISNGYSKLKDVTFRIAHMGDMQEQDMRQLLAWIDEILGL